MEPTPIRLPLRWVLLNIAGALICGAGVYLSQDAQSPAALNLVLLLAGLALMILSLLRILRAARRSGRRDPGI